MQSINDSMPVGPLSQANAISRRAALAWLPGLAALSAGCAGSPTALSGAPAPDADRKANAPLTAADLRWLGRVGFGVDRFGLAHLQQVGRRRYLQEQLAPPAADPAVLAAAIAVLPVAQQSAEQRFRAFRAEQARIKDMPDPEAQRTARNALNRAGNEAVQDTAQRHLLRAVHSPAQLQAQMTWFWMNHFSVYAGKGAVRWTVGEFEEQSVRPHALGRFRDLVLATLTAPAMLEYLDNAQSAAGRINENYARELMELHILGVSGGPSGSHYAQQDVQELARVLTGVGIDNRGAPPPLAPARQALYRHNGLFEFHPGRHDFGAKTLLGQPITGAGFDEVTQAVDRLCRTPAAARFIAARLASYFVADVPPLSLVARMADTFARTDGDIAAVLSLLFLAPELDAALAADARKFKDPMQFVVSSVRLASDGRPGIDMRRVVGWLNQLGEPLYGRVTPDGYPLGETAWASSGQLVRRFEVARAIGSGVGNWWMTADGQPGPAEPPPIAASRLFADAVAPLLGPATRAAMEQTRSVSEWNAVLLSSPEWMQR